MHQPANNTPPQDQTRPIALVFDADYERGHCTILFRACGAQRPA